MFAGRIHVCHNACFVMVGLNLEHGNVCALLDCVITERPIASLYEDIESQSRATSYTIDWHLLLCEKNGIENV